MTQVGPAWVALDRLRPWCGELHSAKSFREGPQGLLFPVGSWAHRALTIAVEERGRGRGFSILLRTACRQDIVHRLRQNGSTARLVLEAH
jgi:hypothetical protein